MKILERKLLKKIHNAIKNKIREILKYMGNLVSGREVSSGGVMDGPPQGVIGNEIGIGGDQISGKWTNTRTGQTVYARQLIDNGGEALVVTDIGVIPMSQFIEFVQIGEEEVGKAEPISPINTNFGNVSMSAEDSKLLAGLNKPKPISENLPSLDKPLSKQNIQQSTVHIETESTNYKIIDKLFNKFDNIRVEVSIDWNDFPKDKLETLTDIFDVPKEEIAEYIVKKYCSIENLKKTITNTL